MKDYTLSQQYAMVALDGLDSVHSTLAKNAVCRGIAAGKLLETLLLTDTEEDLKTIGEAFEAGLKEIGNMNKKDIHSLEIETAAELKASGQIDEVQDLLACDINYSTMDMKLRSYRCDTEAYQRITEGVRAEILEEGAVSLECVCLLWLLRESGCIHDIFTVKEQEQLSGRIIELTCENPVLRLIWDAGIYRWTERLSKNLLSFKKNIFKNPYMEGVNLLFPFFDRRQAIFIDFVVLGTTVAERRLTVLSYLSEHGHYVQEVKNGTETLLKVDNSYYRIFPMTKVYYKVPVQGANLVPVYM